MLTVLQRDPVEHENHHVYWVCKCDCGNTVSVQGDHLRGGRTRSCGCMSDAFRVEKRRVDISGQRFGNLVAISLGVNPQNGNTEWLCKCDCGKALYIALTNLRSGQKSCGCGRFNLGKYSTSHMKKHGACSVSPEYPGDKRLYSVWRNMKQRCFNASCAEYDIYGGRGITICDEWKNSFEAFRDWAYSAGFDYNATSKDCSIDRIDVNGNYEPSNCRWVSALVQSNNKTTNRYFTINGTTRSASEWSAIYGVPYSLVRGRISRGWDIIRALTEPVHEINRHKNNR